MGGNSSSPLQSSPSLDHSVVDSVAVAGDYVLEYGATAVQGWRKTMVGRQRCAAARTHAQGRRA
jgi:hypothetical protein